MKNFRQSREWQYGFCYYITLKPNEMKKWKSVGSINPCPSVIQTSYDIVKAHGGELKVKTKEGEGSEFIILLPM